MSSSLTDEERLEREELADSLIALDDSLPAGKIMMRSDPRTGSFGSRLSTVIRRSLRLGPKRSTTVLKPYSVSAETPSDDTRVGYFTKYSDVKLIKYDKLYGNINELKRLIQLSRATSIKKFVRHNNWPLGHEIRFELWKELCRDRNFDANKQLYIKEVEELTHRAKAMTPNLEILFMDGIDRYDYGLKDTGVASLQRLLIIIGTVRPEITYAPMLYPLCAIFLHYLSEEDTFACIVHLLRGGSKYLHQSSVSYNASPRTLLAVIKKHKSSVYNIIKKRLGTSDDDEIVKAFNLWRQWIFRYLPFDYIVRVIDCFLVEGQKMLLRIAVAIVYIWSKDKTSNASQFVGKSVPERVALLAKQFSDSASNCAVSIQTLLDVAVGIRNLKASTIARIQKQFEDEVRLEELKKAQELPLEIESPARKPSKFLYISSFSSKIINSEVAADIMCALPTRLQLETPKLLFRLTDDGTSFTKLWSKIDEADQTILILETTNGEVFGAYCSASWSERKDVHERSHTRFFGTGESFLWKLDQKEHIPIIYPWIGNGNEHPDNCAQMFMAANEKTLIIGSGDGDAISIRDELYRGMSSASKTFGSPPLASDISFVIRELEVFEVLSGSSLT